MPLPRPEVQPVPENHAPAYGEREGQAVGNDRVMHRLHRLEIRPDGAHVGGGHSGEVRERHGWIEPFPVRHPPATDRSVELLRRPLCDARLEIRRDVWRHHRAERRRNRVSAPEGTVTSCGIGVTRCAVAQRHEIPPALDDVETLAAAVAADMYAG